jgi:hypothetical protein
MGPSHTYRSAGSRPSPAGAGTARASHRPSVINRGVNTGTNPTPTSRAKASAHSSSESACTLTRTLMPRSVPPHTDTSHHNDRIHVTEW